MSTADRDRPSGSFIAAAALALIGCGVLAVAATAAVAPPLQRAAPVAPPSRRVALVIGNATYPSMPLRFTRNDANDMAEALAALGFDVSLLIDGSKVSMMSAISRFLDEARSADVALFYFAGHGEQVTSTAGAENFLLPSDVTPGGGKVNADTSVAVLRDVLDKLGSDTEKRIGIVILDACRTQTATRNAISGTVMPNRTIGGLARMSLPSGTFVAYGTAPGTFAIESPDAQHGRFTASLLKHIATPDLLIEQVFRRVRSDVESESNLRQRPREETALRADQDFYFASRSEARQPGKVTALGGTPPVPTSPSGPGSRIETADIIERVRAAAPSARMRTLQQIIDSRSPTFTVSEVDTLLRSFWRTARPAAFDALISSFPAQMNLQDSGRVFAVGLHGVDREDNYLGGLLYDRVAREGRLAPDISRNTLTQAVRVADTEKDRCAAPSTVAEVDRDNPRAAATGPASTNPELLKIVASDRPAPERLAWIHDIFAAQEVVLSYAETLQLVQSFPPDIRGSVVVEVWKGLPDLFTWREFIDLIATQPPVNLSDISSASTGRLALLQRFIGAGKLDATLTRALQAELERLFVAAPMGPFGASAAQAALNAVMTSVPFRLLTACNERSAP